jgi:hypothetical protein
MSVNLNLLRAHTEAILGYRLILSDAQLRSIYHGCLSAWPPTLERSQRIIDRIKHHDDRARKDNAHV